METISFEQDIVNVNDIIRFVTTTAAFDKICGDLRKQGRTYNLPGYAAEQLKKLSGMQALRISQGKARNSSLFYRIHTLIGVFSCVEDTKNNNGFIISNFFPANLDSQNQAIRSGFTFKAKGGISVKITLNNGLGKGIFCLYINGRENQLTGYKRETDFLSDEKGKRAKKQIVNF